MNAASRAVLSDTQRTVPPLHVLPFNSPLRVIPGIDRVSRSRIYPRGGVVFHEGDVARGVYVLSSGRAKVSISSADGKKLIIRVADSGDVLGLYAGLTGRPFEATAEMLEGGRVDFISREDLQGLIGRQQTPGFDLVEMFSRQFSEFVDHTRMLFLSESALEKLARLIMRWSGDFGEHTSEGVFHIAEPAVHVAECILQHVAPDTRAGIERREDEKRLEHQREVVPDAEPVPAEERQAREELRHAEGERNAPVP